MIFQRDEQSGAVVGERLVFIPERRRLDVFERGRWTGDVEHTTEVSRGAARGPTIARRPVADGGVDGRVGPGFVNTPVTHDTNICTDGSRATTWSHRRRCDKTVSQTRDNSSLSTRQMTRKASTECPNARTGSTRWEHRARLTAFP